MGLSDAYLSPQEYRIRVDKEDEADDLFLESQLSAASRLIENACGQVFNKTDVVETRYYDGEGLFNKPNAAWYSENETLLISASTSTKWVLKDPIASTSGLIVQVDDNADYSHELTLVLNTDFWIKPYNAALLPEAMPYTMLELIPNNAQLSTWPTTRRCVKITALFGWPAVPSAIKEATALVTRQIRDLQQAGVTLTLQNMDAAIRISPRAANIIKDIVQTYGRINQKPLFV